MMKKRFAFLKVFNHMNRQQHIDNSFVTCCILHNILLKEDGYLSSDLPNYPSGVKARLNKIANDPWGVGLWIYDECNDDTFEAALADRVNSPDMERQWLACTQALMNHFQSDNITMYKLVLIVY